MRAVTRTTPFLISGIFVSLPRVGFAAVNPDMVQILTNISSQLDGLSYLVTGAAYLIGISLIMRALYYLKVYGEARTMMAVQSSVKVPIVLIFVGSLFLYFPVAVDWMLNSTFGSNSILGYSDWTRAGGSSDYQTSMKAIFRIVQFVGLVAFVKGWILITHSVQQGGSQQNAFAKGMVHIFGGIMAMNIIGTANLVSNSLGVSFT